MPNSKRRGSSSVDLALGDMNEDEVIASLPEYITQMFNEVGFAKYDKDYHPVIFLNPFYVSEPPDVRVQWQTHYDRFRKSKKVKMAHLVFWYGSDPNKPEFSMMGPNAILTYEQAANLGLNKISEKITKKIAKGTSLTVQEDMFYFGLKDLEADRSTPKEERWERDEPSDAIITPPNTETQPPKARILERNTETEVSTGRARKRAKTNNAAQVPATATSQEALNGQNFPEATARETSTAIAPAIEPATAITETTAPAQLQQRSTPRMEAEQNVMIQVTQQGESESQFVLISPLSTLKDVLTDLDVTKEDNQNRVPILKYRHGNDEDTIVIKEKNINKWVLKNFMESLNVKQGTIIKFTLEYHDAN